MATYIQGAAGTGNINTELLARDVYNKIIMKRPDLKKLSIIFNKLGHEKAYEEKVEHFEQELKATQFAIGANFTYASDTTITVPAGSWQQLVAGSVIRHQKTGAQYIVSATPTTTTVTLTGTAGATVWGETAGADATSGDYFWILGVAKMQGAEKMDMAAVEPVEAYNYTVIHEETFGVTKTDDAVKQYGKPRGDYNYRRAQAMDNFQVQWEQKLLFGELKRDTSGTHYRQMLRGIYKFAVDGGNIKYYDGTLTDAEIIEFVKMCSANTSEPGLLLAGLGLIQQLSTLAFAKLQLAPEKKAKYGFDIYELITGFRPVYVTTHRLLGGDLAKYGILVTIDNMMMKDLRPIDVEDDVHTPGADRREGLIRQESSIRLAKSTDFGVLSSAAS